MRGWIPAFAGMTSRLEGEGIRGDRLPLSREQEVGSGDGERGRSTLRQAQGERDHPHPNLLPQGGRDKKGMDSRLRGNDGGIGGNDGGVGGNDGTGRWWRIGGIRGSITANL